MPKTWYRTPAYGRSSTSTPSVASTAPARRLAADDCAQQRYSWRKATATTRSQPSSTRPSTAGSWPMRTRRPGDTQPGSSIWRGIPGVIVLRELQGLSYKEISDVAGVRSAP